MMIIVTCKVCGKDFEVKPSRLKGGDLCCSYECSNINRRRERVPNVKCWACGKAFWIAERHLNVRTNPDRICCSRECSKLERSDRMSGGGNHQYGLKGELNSSFRADFYITNYGYIKIRCITHPLADVGGFVLFHRVVYEEYLRESCQFDLLEEIDGQLVLPRDLIVHHIDGNKFNNSLGNLESCTLEEHTSLHIGEVIETKSRDIQGRFAKEGKKKTGKLDRKYQFDAGQDVFSSESKIIPPRNSAVVGTGLCIEVPKGCVGLLWSRSGLSVKHKVEVGAGCIDCGYTGEVKVHLYNHGNVDFVVDVGDRIAQLLTIPINLNNYVDVSELEDTKRGSGGFGHSGRR